ncbi:hypothetical protein CKQ90_33320, partial [Klebsiella pneumoniae]
MAPEKIQQALRDIREYVDSFDYPRLLSNLFHRRVAPAGLSRACRCGLGLSPKMAPEKIQQALRDIREYVDSFDYPRL